MPLYSIQTKLVPFINNFQTLSSNVKQIFLKKKFFYNKRMKVYFLLTKSSRMRVRWAEAQISIQHRSLRRKALCFQSIVLLAGHRSLLLMWIPQFPVCAASLSMLGRSSTKLNQNLALVICCFINCVQLPETFLEKTSLSLKPNWVSSSWGNGKFILLMH